MNCTVFNLRQAREQLGISQAKLAELTQIPQRLLSAYELGKVDIPLDIAGTIRSILLEPSRVEALATRKKRYRAHQYKSVEHVPERVARTHRTVGNENYVQMLNQLKPCNNSADGLDPRAISLFSGCGGLSLGFAAAGFRIQGSLEIVPGLRQIYHTNMPDTKELGTDITAITDSDLKSLRNTIGSIDVIIGGPPCQGFSLSGKRRIDDPRNSLFRQYMRFVDTFCPRVAVLENVRLLTSMKNTSGGLVKNEIAQGFRRHGYEVNLYEVNAKFYGVPQHRERVFFVAVRKDTGVLPSFPSSTHGVDSDLFGTVKPFRTFADACSDLPYIESGEGTDDSMHCAVNHPAHVIEWLWEVPEGSSAHDNDDQSLRPPSGYNTTYKRQIWCEPASTVQTTFGMISGCRNVHPIATRALTIREAARIQSFPDWFRFKGTAGIIRTGLGNAVPPLLAKVIAEHIRSELI